MDFELIKNIRIDDEESWKHKIFLTFDMEWSNDNILEYLLNYIDRYSLKATVFVTHKTQLLERMKKNPNIELGIHPNYNFLLEGDFRYGRNFDEVTSYYYNLVENPISVRSHSMTQNSRIVQNFSQYGLIYDCNHFIPIDSGIELKPWKYWNEKMIKIPYIWEDDIHLSKSKKVKASDLLSYDGLKVLDFHPLQIFINTHKIENYYKVLKTKEYKKNVNQVYYGIRDYLNDIITLVKENRRKTCKN